MRKETDKQVNVTLSAQQYEDLKSYCDRHHLPVATFLKQAAETVSLEEYKAAVPEQADQISAFRSNLDQILAAYKSALDGSANAYDIAAGEVKAQLDGMKDLAATNRKQLEEIKQLNQKNAENEKLISEQKKRIEELERELASANKKAEECDSLRKEKLDLQQRLIDQRDEQSKQVKELQDENFRKLLEVIKNR